MPRSWLSIRLVLTIVSALGIRAQDYAVSAPPLLGYVLEGQERVREIVGLPGAGVLGRAYRPGAPFRGASISPRQDFLVLKGEGGALYLLRLPPPGQTEVLPAPISPDGWRFSPHGRTIALHYGETNRLRWLTGLPDAPVPAGELDLTGLPGPLGPYAVSDDGSTLLLASGGSLFRYDNNFLSLEAEVGDVSAIEFFGGSSEAVVADHDRNVIYRWSKSGYTVLGDESRGITAPSSLAISTDNQLVIAVVNRGRGLVAIELETGRAVAVEAGCLVLGLDRLRANRVFRVLVEDENPVWLFDADRPEPGLFVVPRGWEDITGGEQ